MRTCARMDCRNEPVATITLRYAERRIVVGALLPERDPHLLDLCGRHVAGMTAPVGWLVDDARMLVLTPTAAD